MSLEMQFFLAVEYLKLGKGREVVEVVGLQS